MNIRILKDLKGNVKAVFRPDRAASASLSAKPEIGEELLQVDVPDHCSEMPPGDLIKHLQELATTDGLRGKPCE